MQSPKSSDSSAPPVQHTPVLLHEAVDALNPSPGKRYVDGTLGGGGHARYLASKLDATSRIIGIDQDPTALLRAQEALQDCGVPITFLRGNVGELGTLLFQAGIGSIDGGILLDLGVSDFQIRTADRGFSFREDAPLDMRMNPDLPRTAADLVNTLPADELADLIFRNADEKLSRPLARAIIAARPLATTRQLAGIAEAVYKQKGIRPEKIHPATRLFQALRMAVNQELAQLESCLNQLPALLAPGARVAIITFHSGEDRLVKQYFREASAPCLCPPRQPVCTCNHRPAFTVIGKPVVPSDEEIARNPQARSAKLRIAERLADTLGVAT